MPTQVPSGSALAVKNPQRRRARGPRILAYARGGKVKAFKPCNECSGGTAPFCKANGRCMGKGGPK